MSKTLNNIGILIRQIDSAGIADISVNNGDFLMVPIVKGQSGNVFDNRRKNADPNAKLRQFMPDLIAVHKETAKIIQKQTDFNFLDRFSCQNLLQSIPYLPIGHDKILEKNKLFRLFQVLKKGVELFLSHIKIADRCVLIYRKAFLNQISTDLSLIGVHFGQLGQNRRVLGLIFPPLFRYLFIFFIKSAVCMFASPHKIKTIAKHRKRQNNDNPEGIEGG